MPAAPVVLISGATGALGRATALKLGGAGYRVGVHYHRNESAARRLCRAIERAGGRAIALGADLRYRATVEQLTDALLRRWRRVDLLVHCAGGLRDGLLVRMTTDDWRGVVDTHLTSAFHLLQAVGRVMIAQRGGQILLIGSIAGLRGRAGQANYAAAKAGLVALTMTAAREWGRHNIQVNCLLPGYLAAGMGARMTARRRAQLSGDQLLARRPTAARAADAIAALSRLRHISGQIINADSRLV